MSKGLSHPRKKPLPVMRPRQRTQAFGDGAMTGSGMPTAGSARIQESWTFEIIDVTSAGSAVNVGDPVHGTWTAAHSRILVESSARGTLGRVPDDIAHQMMVAMGQGGGRLQGEIVSFIPLRATLRIRSDQE
jgi:hypothetical protein